MALKKKIKGAMTYPTICLAISFLILGVILIFVIPVFEEMFSSMGAALPIPTQIVVQLSNFAKSNFLYIIMGIFGIIYAVKRTYGTERGRYRIDALLLRAPVIGTLVRKVAVAKFCRTLSTMLIFCFSSIIINAFNMKVLFL